MAAVAANVFHVLCFIAMIHVVKAYPIVGFATLTGSSATTRVSLLETTNWQTALQPTVGFATLLGSSATTRVSLLETTNAQKALVFVLCNSNNANCGSCSVTALKDASGNGITTVSSSVFATFRFINDNGYRLFFTGTQATFTSVTSSNIFTVTVTCTLTTNSTDPGSSDIIVDIVPNQPPTVTPVNRVVTLDAAVSPATLGAAVHSISATDNDGDSLTYTMTQSPANNYFSLGSSDGVIRTAVDRRTIAVAPIIALVTVSDGTTTVTATVTVSIANQNTRPFISNLPASVNVSESQTAGINLKTLTFGDNDLAAGATLVPECSVSPSQEASKFQYQTNSANTGSMLLNTITSGTTLLDHETTDRYTITCVVSDGYLSSQGDVLTVFINNVNEAPVFSPTSYSCTLQESNAGVNSCQLGLSFQDPERDVITTVALLAGNNSERFRYDRTTDRLTFNVNYDVDNGNMPTNVIITIYAVDSNQATGSALVEVTIQDANDNVCDFGASQAAQFSINQGTPLGILGNFFASDADLTSPNNAITYELLVGNPVVSTSYLNVFGNGQISYVGLIPESEHGKSFSVTVRCKDGSTSPRSSTGTVQITYLTTTTSTTTTTTTTTTPTTTVTTTTTKPSVWDDTTFAAVFAALIALLAIGLLVALYYFCCRGGKFQSMMQGPPKQQPPLDYYRRQGQYRTPPNRVQPARDQYDGYPYDPRRQYDNERPPPDDYMRRGQYGPPPDYYRDNGYRHGTHYNQPSDLQSTLTKSDVNLSIARGQRALMPPVERSMSPPYY